MPKRRHSTKKRSSRKGSTKRRRKSTKGSRKSSSKKMTTKTNMSRFAKTIWKKSKSAGGKGKGKRQAIWSPANMPEFTDATFFITQYVIVTGIAGNVTSYWNWSLVDAFDPFNAAAATVCPGYASYAEFYDVWRPQGSSTAVEVCAIRGPTEITDGGSQLIVTLVPHGPQDGITGGIIAAGSAQNWDELRKDSVCKRLWASDYAKNAVIKLRGKYTTDFDLEGNSNFQGLTDFTTQVVFGVSPTLKASWNLVLMSMDNVAADTYSCRIGIRTYYTARFSSRTDFTEATRRVEKLAKCHDIRSREAGETYFYWEHGSPKSTAVMRPVFSALVHQPKFPSDEKDDDLTMESLSLTLGSRPESKEELPRPQVVEERKEEKKSMTKPTQLGTTVGQILARTKTLQKS